MRIYPEIGSKYRGPQYDRAALRRMPADWRLSEIPETVQNLWILLSVAVIAYAVCTILWFI